MVVPLWVRYLAYTRSFKKICSDCSPRDLPMLIELNLYKFTKTTGITIQSFKFLFKCTYSKHLQQQKDVGLALQKQLLCTAPSFGYHTNVAVVEKDSQLSGCSPCRCDSHIFRSEQTEKQGCQVLLAHGVLKNFTLDQLEVLVYDESIALELDLSFFLPFDPGFINSREMLFCSIVIKEDHWGFWS